METNPNLEFLATKSKELIDKQIASYRQQHTTASSIIAVVALFIPLFLSGLEDANVWLKCFSVIPVIFFVIAICILLFHVFRSHSLSQALSFTEFQRLVTKNDLEESLLFEMGANQSAFQENKKILKTRNEYYNYSVILTILGIMISVLLLMLNKFINPQKQKEPIQIEVIKTISITDSTKVDTVFITETIKTPEIQKKKAQKKCYPSQQQD